jgi:hypothetical protein
MQIMPVYARIKRWSKTALNTVASALDAYAMNAARSGQAVPPLPRKFPSVVLRKYIRRSIVRMLNFTSNLVQSAVRPVIHICQNFPLDFQPYRLRHKV